MIINELKINVFISSLKLKNIRVFNFYEQKILRTILVLQETIYLIIILKVMTIPVVREGLSFEWQIFEMINLSFYIINKIFETNYYVIHLNLVLKTPKFW